VAIIFDSRKIMVYEDLKYLCEFTGKGAAFAEELWQAFLKNDDLYNEFLYYIDNRTFKDAFSFEGYSLTDIYVYMLGRFNLINDTGKNTEACNKETMVLETFMGMVELMANPAEYVKKLDAGRGMDKLF